MSILQRPPLRAGDHPRLGKPTLMRKVMLASGIAAALLYGIAHDVLAAILWPSYSPFSQAISELSAIGAPTRAPVTVVSFLFAFLTIVFGFGIWQSSKGNRALRITGGLFIGSGALWPLWLPFPARLRGEVETSTTALIGHTAIGAVTVLLMFVTIGFSAAALGKGFRIYALVTLAIVFVFGALTFVYAPRLAAGESTPWMGVIERINIGAWLLWIAVLSIVLLRGHTGASEHS